MNKLIKSRLNIILHKLNIQQNIISHHYIENLEHTIFLMTKSGNGMCSVYWFDDSDISIYIANLSVSENYRGLDIGNILFDSCEEIGKSIGAKSSTLWVLKNSWMHEWYGRKGYSDFKPYEGDSKLIWMKKIL